VTAYAVIDAAHFVPQSRKRVFVIGAHESLGDVAQRVGVLLDDAVAALPKRVLDLADVLDLASRFVEFSLAEVERHLAMMTPEQLKRVEYARSLGRPVAVPFARRGGRPVRAGGVVVGKESRVEARFDGLANALRVAETGGSSKQFVMIVNGSETRMRAINPREGARLMGLPETFVLPNDPIFALSMLGDGVVAPVVRWLAERVLEPLLDGRCLEQPEGLVEAAQRDVRQFNLDFGASERI
jgi:DNA (cytosine-5)-methyltransferase 1